MIWHHPNVYKKLRAERKKIKKDSKEHKLSSAQASKREGGPTSEQAHNLHANNSARFVEGAQAQLGRKPKCAR